MIIQNILLIKQMVQAFSPNEQLKTGEVLTRQNIPFCITEIHIDLPTTAQELVQKYQVILALMQGDIASLSFLVTVGCVSLMSSKFWIIYIYIYTLRVHAKGRK